MTPSVNRIRVCSSASTTDGLADGDRIDHPEHRAGLPDGMGLLSGADQQGTGVTAEGDRQVTAAGGLAHEHQAHRAHLSIGLLLAERAGAVARASLAGRASSIDTARSVWRASAVTLAASGPLPHTSPMTSIQPRSPQGITS